MSQPSKQIAGRYQLGERIGRGGMGDVYLGIDMQTGEKVAIKLLKPEIVQDSPDLVERFDREGEMLRRLNHPSIVKVLATIEEDDNHYIVMEYVSGGSLQDVLDNEQLPINRILNIALDIADALTRAHRLNIVHRDIKPANVLLAEDGTPRLTDFGVAHMGDRTRMTETGSIIGTYAYLSPEACNGEELDERTDIWSFGVMLYEMITGRRPFASTQTAAIIMQILTETQPPLSEYRPDTPPELVMLINNMLEKDRGNRIPTVRRVGAALETLIRGLELPNLTDSQLAVSKAKSRFATPTPSQSSPELDGQTITPEPTSPSQDSVNIIVEQAQSKWGLRRSGKWVNLVLAIVAIVIIILIATQIGGSDDDDGANDSDSQSESNNIDNLSPEVVGNSVEEGDYLIIVAELEPIDDTEVQSYSRFITEDLFQTLEQNIVSSKISVRQYPQIIASDDAAREAVEAQNATIIIWGRYTNDFIQLEIQVGSAERFSYIPFPRDSIERAANLRVRMSDPFEESVAPQVLSIINTLHLANGDGFASLFTSAILNQIGNINSPEVVGNTVAAYSYRAYALLYANDDNEQIQNDIEEQIDAGLTIEQHPLLYIQRSIWHWQQGRPQESREDALTAQRLASQGYQADAWTMPLYLFAIGNSASDEVIDIFSQVIAAHPDDWYAHQVRGSVYYFQGQFDLAKADIEQALELEPTANFPYAFATLLALREARFFDAVQYIRTVVTDFPDPSFGQRLIGVTFGENTLSFYGGLYASFTNLALGQYADVVREANAALELTPVPELYLIQGLGYCNLGDYAAAEAAYTAGIDLEEDLIVLYFLRSEVRFLQDDIQGSSDDLEVVRQSDFSEEFESLITAATTEQLTCENFFTYSPEE